MVRFGIIEDSLKLIALVFLQHGPYECLLNTVEACAINAWPDLVSYSFQLFLLLQISFDIM